MDKLKKLLGTWKEGGATLDKRVKELTLKFVGRVEELGKQESIQKILSFVCEKCHRICRTLSLCCHLKFALFVFLETHVHPAEGIKRNTKGS